MGKDKVQSILSELLDTAPLDYQQSPNELFVKFKVNHMIYEYRLTRDLLLEKGIYFEAINPIKQFENEVKYLQRARERGIGSEVYMPFLNRI